MVVSHAIVGIFFQVHKYFGEVRGARKRRQLADSVERTQERTTDRIYPGNQFRNPPPLPNSNNCIYPLFF
jgi:hypothetical protein